ncbi:MAG: hypothetical protein R3B99_31585 [Polyangiales bacterium]
MAGRLLILGLALLGAACGLSRNRTEEDGGVADAGRLGDASDASDLRDAFTPDAPEEDAAVDTDAGFDDGGLDDGSTAACDELCTTSTECEVAACVDGECVVDVAPAGTACGELVMGMLTGVWVWMAPAARAGCGDGYVEPGPS